MELQEYIKLIEISQGQAASELSVARQTLNGAITGRTPATKELASRIRVWSKGAVKVKDLPGWENFK